MIDLAAHVSDLRWDQLVAGDLAAADAARAEEHARACARCAARYDQLRADAAAFAAIAPPLPASPAPRQGRRARWIALGATAAAAAIVLVIARPAPSSDTRTKGGGPSLVLAAGRGTAIAPLASGDRLHPGDSLQAAYTADRAGYGAVLSRDGAGAAGAYVPSRGDVTVALPAGAMASFPESTVLDDVTGDEVIVVLWCASPHPLAPMLAELQATGSVTAPADCTARRLELAKVAR